jgi:hypothetical protein
MAWLSSGQCGTAILPAAHSIPSHGGCQVNGGENSLLGFSVWSLLHFITELYDIML